MKLAVCFKILPDYGRLSAASWQWDRDHRMDIDYIRRIFNCFDESTLEMGLILRAAMEKDSTPVELTALTVDDRRADLFLKHLAAVGYDKVVRVACPPEVDLRFNPRAVSGLIAAYLRRAGHRLVFLGRQGGEGDNGQTGFLVAERLGWPCIRDVSAVSLGESPGRFKVTSHLDGAALVQTITPPVVLIAGHCPDTPYLRSATLRQKLDAKNRAVTRLTAARLGFHGSQLEDREKRLMDFQRPPAKAPCVFLEGDTPGQQARQLYEHYLKRIWGSP